MLAQFFTTSTIRFLIIFCRSAKVHCNAALLQTTLLIEEQKLYCFFSYPIVQA